MTQLVRYQHQGQQQLNEYGYERMMLLFDRCRREQGKAMSRTVTLRRQWRDPPDPVDGIRPLTFYADANALDVEAVHVFPADGHVALSFITALGSVNVRLPLTLAQEVGSGMLRLTSDAPLANKVRSR